MRIVIYLPTLSGGGAERVTLALAGQLASRGHDMSIVVASAAGELAGQVPSNVNLVDLQVRRVAASWLPLRRALIELKPDIVLSVLTHANVVSASVVRSLRRRPALILMHHNMQSINARRSPRYRDRVVLALVGRTYRLADAVVAVSEGVRSDLLKHSHLPGNLVSVVPNPVDYDRIARLAAEGDTALAPRPTGRPLIVASGRLVEQKGFDVALHALSFMTVESELVIMGDGPERNALEELAQTLGVRERVEFPGFVENPYAVLARADVFALSSRWEGLPTVLLEALGFDLRIVATDCESGPREILRDGTDGVLVPVDDALALAHALDAAVTGKTPQPGPDAAERYTTATATDRLEDLVAQVCSRHLMKNAFRCTSERPRRAGGSIRSGAGWPMRMAFRITARAVGPNAALRAWSQVVGLVPDGPGTLLREVFLSQVMSIGDACSISFGTVFSKSEASLGDRVYVGQRCTIGWALIESDVLIGDGVHVLSGSKQHGYAALDTPIRDQAGTFTPVRIGAGSWVGSGAVVMADVGEHSIVGAGAVVTTPVPPYSIVAGNPAVVVRERRPRTQSTTDQ